MAQANTNCSAFIALGAFVGILLGGFGGCLLGDMSRLHRVSQDQPPKFMEKDNIAESVGLVYRAIDKDGHQYYYWHQINSEDTYNHQWNGIHYVRVENVK